MSVVWSVSQSATWRCPLQWWFRYRGQVPAAQPDAFERVRGRAEHVAMEAAYKAAAADSAWEPGVRMERHWEVATEALRAYWTTTDPQVAESDVHRAVEDVTAVLDTLPAPRPDAVLGVEKPVVVEWTVEGFTVMIKGVIDLALWLGVMAHVRDWKHNTIGEPRDSPQLAVYDQGMRDEAWERGKDIRVGVGLYSIRQNREVAEVLPDRRRRELLHKLVYDAASAYDAMGDELAGASVLAAFPPKPDPDMCGSCPFRSYCPETSAGTWPVKPGVDVDAVRVVVSTRLRKVGSTR